MYIYIYMRICRSKYIYTPANTHMYVCSMCTPTVGDDVTFDGAKSRYFGTEHLPADYWSEYVKVKSNCLKSRLKNAAAAVASFALLCGACNIYLHVVRSIVRGEVLRTKIYGVAPIESHMVSIYFSILSHHLSCIVCNLHVVYFHVWYRHS